MVVRSESELGVDRWAECCAETSVQTAFEKIGPAVSPCIYRRSAPSITDSARVTANTDIACVLPLVNHSVRYVNGRLLPRALRLQTGAPSRIEPLSLIAQLLCRIRSPRDLCHIVREGLASTWLAGAATFAVMLVEVTSIRFYPPHFLSVSHCRHPT